jgi:D-3-phosphoglycerate dehydrogenase
MAKVSLGKDKIKFLLVEGVHQSAVDTLHAAGYTNIEFHKGALDTEALKESIRDAHFVGIRSRSQLTEEVFAAAEKLVAVGCFCIGTNQVNLTSATKRGIPVFNAPFSNTRSVAEMVLGEMLLMTVVSGTSWPWAPMKRAANVWVSSAMAISVRSWVFWPKVWG